MLSFTVQRCVGCAPGQGGLVADRPATSLVMYSLWDPNQACQNNQLVCIYLLQLQPPIQAVCTMEIDTMQPAQLRLTQAQRRPGTLSKPPSERLAALTCDLSTGSLCSVLILYTSQAIIQRRTAALHPTSTVCRQAEAADFLSPQACAAHREGQLQLTRRCIACPTSTHLPYAATHCPEPNPVLDRRLPHMLAADQGSLPRCRDARSAICY